MEDSESSAGLKRKDRTKSSAWAHFGVKTTEDGSAVCLYCKRSVVPRNGNAKQKHLGCKKCEANQKQHASRQVRPKALISAEAKKLATLSKKLLTP